MLTPCLVGWTAGPPAGPEVGHSPGLRGRLAGAEMCGSIAAGSAADPQRLHHRISSLECEVDFVKVVAVIDLAILQVKQVMVVGELTVPVYGQGLQLSIEGCYVVCDLLAVLEPWRYAADGHIFGHSFRCGD